MKYTPCIYIQFITWCWLLLFPQYYNNNFVVDAAVSASGILGNENFSGTGTFACYGDMTVTVGKVEYFGAGRENKKPSRGYPQDISYWGCSNVSHKTFYQLVSRELCHLMYRWFHKSVIEWLYNRRQYVMHCIFNIIRMATTTLASWIVSRPGVQLLLLRK